jgi:hypothetical protein
MGLGCRDRSRACDPAPVPPFAAVSSPTLQDLGFGSRRETNSLRVSQNLDPCARSYRGLEVSDPCITILNIRSLLHYIPRGLPGPLEALIPGSHGRVLAVLAKTDAELTMRTVAKLSGTSIGSASGVLNHLAHLGLVERREVGSAVSFGSVERTRPQDLSSISQNCSLA